MVRFEENGLVIVLPSNDAIESWMMLHEQLCTTLQKVPSNELANTWMLLTLLEELMPEPAVADRMLNAVEGKEAEDGTL
jgi:hypothetical protein